MACNSSGKAPARKNLIRPVEAYVLLPDRLCDGPDFTSSMDRSTTTPCLSDLLIKTFHFSKWLVDTELTPLNWLQLKLDPQKTVSVVAAVVPLVNCAHPRIHSGGYQYSPARSSRESIIETLNCVRQWNFNKLINLQVIIIVPWPDPALEVIEREKYIMSNAYSVHKALKNGKQVTLGVHQSFYQRSFIDLSKLDSDQLQIFFIADHFEQSTAELAIALLTAISRGVFKDCNAVYKDWISTLVGPHSYSLNVQQHKYQPLTSRCPTIQLDRNDSAREFVLPPSLTSQYYRQTRSTRRRSTPVHQAIRTINLLTSESWTSQSRQLEGSRLGMIGLTTSLAQSIANMAHHGLKMNVSYYQKHPIPDAQFIYRGTLKELLQSSDVIMLADDSLNQHQSWNSLIGSHRITGKHKNRPHFWLTYGDFANVRPQALLICVTSVQCIDFAALSLALRYGQLSGAGVTMPTVWFTKVADMEGVRRLPNTFILPPATSSVCAHPNVRLGLAQEVIRLIARALSEPMEWVDYKAVDKIQPANSPESLRIRKRSKYQTNFQGDEQVNGRTLSPPNTIQNTCNKADLLYLFEPLEKRKLGLLTNLLRLRFKRIRKIGLLHQEQETVKAAFGKQNV